MRTYRGTLLGLGVVAALTIVACSSGLPANVSGTGGAAATPGTGGSAVSGTGGVGIAGRVPMVHQPTEGVCSGEVVEAEVKTSIYDGGDPGPRAPDGGGFISCSVDSDCPPCESGQLDRCLLNGIGTDPGQCACDACNRNEDCPGTESCICAGAASTQHAHASYCIQGNCRVDADCGPGGFVTVHGSVFTRTGGGRPRSAA